MRVFFLAVALLGAPATLAAQVGQDTTLQAEVRAAVHAYHAALAAGDSAGAIQMLHPDVVIFESGRAETLAQYRGGHLPADIRFAAATQRQLISEAVSVSGEQALYTAESRTTGRFRDRDIDARGVETVALVRTTAGWRIRHIHWSSR